MKTKWQHAQNTNRTKSKITCKYSSSSWKNLYRNLAPQARKAKNDTSWPRSKKKVKSFPEPQGPMGRHWSPFTSPQLDTSLSRKSMDTGQCIAWYVHLLPSFRSYSLTDPGGMARWVGNGAQQPRVGFEPTTWPRDRKVRHRTTRHRAPK